MVDHRRPLMCPVLRKLITLVARKSRFPRLHEHGQLIDQLTDLEAEGVANNAPWRTLEAIRATRMKLRVDGLMPRSTGLRGH
jgi:hypothetical protein